MDKIPGKRWKAGRSFRLLFASMATGFTIWWCFFALPDPMFDDPYSTILLDSDGKLLSGRIASDEQWRFPEAESVPEHFAVALQTFEDKRFRSHIGVDPIAMGRAVISNIRAGSIVSGGSTLTMQLIRISGKGKDRSVWQKGIEMLLALRAECRYSKDEILRLYASHAPFGGNVVGLEAASWRYFGKPPELLSWSEATCLAVLPNSPALIHPGRGRELLKEKRNRVLMKLIDQGVLDSIDGQLALLEPLPDAPLPLPDEAPHLLSFLKQASGTRISTTIERQIQYEAQQVLKSHHAILSQNAIQNGAILVMDTESGEVLAYVGNVEDLSFRHENAVDMVQAERSSGSILKPLLYASAFHTGQLLPEMLIEDIPTNLNGYQPENFTRTYSGMVRADEALIRSLNVPAVLVLKDYGIERFRQELIQSGLKTIRHSAEHYGLPLILGGAEVTLWDICGVYASMGRMLTHAYPLNHRYDHSDLHAPVATLPKTSQRTASVNHEPVLWDYGSLWLTLSAMRDLSRPAEDGQWEYFQSEKPIAWKTGTSFGFRDAWAVGVTPEYTVGVWIGNADGEGRPGLVGVRAAAPVMFDVFRNLPGGSWWTPPYDALEWTMACRESGYPAGPDCTSGDSMLVSEAGMLVERCPYHLLVHTDAAGDYRIHHDCHDNREMHPRSYFVLPPGPASYYRKSNPTYRPLPPFHPHCAGGDDLAQIQVIYPARHTRIYIPRELNGESASAVFKVAHRSPSAQVFWYLDNQYLGSTKEFHTMEIRAIPGDHKLIITDGSGSHVERSFEVVGA